MTEDRLALIRRWNMAGAPGWVDNDVAPSVAVVGELGDEPTGEVPPPVPSSLLEPADEDDWQPLVPMPYPA
jgi:hypothetical protein